jgi:hypothetical protein
MYYFWNPGSRSPVFLVTALSGDRGINGFVTKMVGNVKENPTKIPV